ncbi:HNH endonuclease [Streptomyces buecherae]|uniref:HNH endonuclease n=1 Tax=Streptomyces buecherae TaxID=2763006 RepID=UPI0037A17D79
MALRDITRVEVLRAIEECDRLGRDAFLRAYGFGEARRLRLSYGGKLYDSKAIVGAAHGHLPGRSALAAEEFSGGVATVGSLLRQLGFAVVDTGAGQDDGERGPALEYSAFEAAIADLRMRSTRQGPALYQPILLLWAVGRARRGDSRLDTWSTTEREVGRLLSQHGARGERPRPDYPAAALHRAGLWDMRDHRGPVPSAHGDNNIARWFATHQPRTGLPLPVYERLRDSASDRARAVGTLLTYFDGVDPQAVRALLVDVGLDEEATHAPAGANGEVPHAARVAAQYDRLCRSVERDEAARRGRRVPRQSQRPLRSAPAREAVLLRCGGRCENPYCPGQPDDRTDAGQPILEVDHVVEITADGRDHPSQMIALCPNCHAVKTRGSTREAFRAELLRVAARLHQAIRPEPGSGTRAETVPTPASTSASASTPASTPTSASTPALPSAPASELGGTAPGA